MLKRTEPLYCLDSNVLIQAWNFYYSPNLAPNYWDMLNNLGQRGIIFIPMVVYEEISKKDDGLFDWLKSSKIPKREICEEVTKCLQQIFQTNPNHEYLVAENSTRSAADPWVIAHAIKENAIVVSKENKDLNFNPRKIRIPHVCENMQIKCITDFQFLEEIKVIFNCSIN